MIKKITCLCLAFMTALAFIPENTAYAGTSVTSMQNVYMNQHYQYQELGYNFDNAGNPIPRKGTGPLYDDIYFDSDAVWSRKTDGGINYVTPGERDNAAFAFCIDLEKSKLLGAARKGELYVTASATFRNYSADGDNGKTFVIEYSGGGAYLREHNSAAYDNNGDWYGRGFTSDANIGKDASYLLFGAYGKREGGASNKNLNFDVSNIYGKITDQTGPKVVSISDTATVNGKQYVRQDINKNDPSIYITMDEDCAFSSGNTVSLETEGGTSGSKITELIYVGEAGRDNSTGRVTYKFRINIAVGRVASGHYTKVRLWNLSGVKDTMGNSIGQTQAQYQAIDCNKLIDTQAPYVTYPVNGDLRTIKVEDKFGLSKVNRNMIYLKDTAFSVGGDKNVFEVGDLENQPFSTSTKSVSVDFGMLTYAKTGLYEMSVTAADLAKNPTIGAYTFSNIFIISDSDPLKLSLKKDNAKLDISSGDISSKTTDALTTMKLEADTSAVPVSRLSGATIYYRWLDTRNDSVLSSFTSEKDKWRYVGFQSNSSATEPLTIPVTYKTDGSLEYLEPKFTDGYLYVIPEIDDDISTGAVYRTGSMAAGGRQTDGKFESILESKPVKGSFVNRGCNECTGETPTDDTAEKHYYAVRNHSGYIGLDVDNNQDLSKIMWSISERGVSNSVLYNGTIVKGQSGQYDVPISDIAGKTGSYTVTAALHSVYGDITIKKIDVNIESPVIGISAGSILYDQSRKNLDFTLTYNKESLENLSDIIIQFGGRDITGFSDVVSGTSISTYAISEGGVIAKENWDSEMGNKFFIRTAFIDDSSDSRLMTADFRASLSNMEKAGDEFIKNAGEKRVHLKYITSNKVETINNNITVIKKSDLPPSITLTAGAEGRYFTATEYNDASNPGKIRVNVEEPILTLKNVYYKWADSASSTLLKAGGGVKGDAIGGPVSGKEIEISPAVPALTADELYKPLFLLVYAENEADKGAEKVFGPFYVLNENINDKRFMITLNDRALDESHVLAAVDDKLNMVEDLVKADKLKVTWMNGTSSVVRKYGLSFVKGQGEEQETTNVSLVNIPYPALSDTEGAGGTYVLNKAEIYNSADETKIFKSLVPAMDIKYILPEYFVKIEAISDGAKVTSSTDEISYGWSENPYDIPSSWTATGGAIVGVNFIPAENGSLISNQAYLFVKALNNIYRSDKIPLNAPAGYNPVTVSTVKLGEGDNTYYGPENGKKDILIRLSVTDSSELGNIGKVEVYDLFSATSGTAINADKLFRISSTKAAGIVPGLTTSGGAIKCSVYVNDVKIDDFEIKRAGDMQSTDFDFVRENRVITLNNKAEYLNYTLYDNQDKAYTFDSDGKTEIFTKGSYLLTYADESNNLFAEIIDAGSVTYSDDDVNVSLSPGKPLDGTKVTSPVTATVTMPLGSVISDRYGIIGSMANTGNRTVATATVTRSAIYAFDIKFADDSTLKNYTVTIDYIGENYVPEADAVTPAAISYDITGITKDNVTVSLDSSLEALNNNNSEGYTFNRNGRFGFIIKDTDGTLKEHVAEVTWIDKKCPEPAVRKFVWIDSDNDGLLDAGEKGIEIPEGYTTRYNVAVEITFPKDGENPRPVKLSGSAYFTPEDADGSGYAYKYVMAYKPVESEGNRPNLIQNLTFTDTLGNTAEYGLIIDEIDRTELMTALNYSTTSPTNRDVVVSMSSNKAIERFDLIEEIDAGGNINVTEKSASPTYVFRQNGTKDFRYREINVTEDPEEGMLRANVTWIDKSVPKVDVQYPGELTNQSVVIDFIIENGVALGARLKYGVSEITLEPSGGDDLKGTFTANENGRYVFTVTTKYGNTGTFIVPVTNIDKDSPEISINGREETYIKAGTDYYDQGASAYDKRDGNITTGISVKSSVNTAVATGSDYYTVVYTVSDKAGNTGTRTRKVHVLDIDSAVAVIENNIIDLKSRNVHDVKLPDTGIAYVEFVGIDGSYTAKYQSGENDEQGNEYDNAYFKRNGRYLSKVGTVTADYGVYTFYMQDQERNTRLIKINFVK